MPGPSRVVNAWPRLAAGVWLPAILLTGACGSLGSSAKEEDAKRHPSEPPAEPLLAERLAAGLCAAMVECACPEVFENFATEAQCRNELEQEFATAQRKAQQAGYTYDGECAASFIDLWRDSDCASLQVLLDSCSSPPSCSIYSGAALGTCVPSNYLSTACPQGYVCAVATPWEATGPAPSSCQSIAEPTMLGVRLDHFGVQIGGASSPKPGDSCPPPYRNCGCGSYCSDDGVCVAYGHPGDACRSDRPCDHLSSYCDTSTGRCAARRSFGEPCSGIECGSGLYCGPMDICVPGVGPGVCEPQWVRKFDW